MVHSIPDLFLEGFCWVGLGCLEVSLVYEVLYFLLILSCREDY